MHRNCMLVFKAFKYWTFEWKIIFNIFVYVEWMDGDPFRNLNLCLFGVSSFSWTLWYIFDQMHNETSMSSTLFSQIKQNSTQIQFWAEYTKIKIIFYLLLVYLFLITMVYCHGCCTYVEFLFNSHHTNNIYIWILFQKYFTIFSLHTVIQCMLHTLRKDDKKFRTASTFWSSELYNRLMNRKINDFAFIERKLLGWNGYRV